MELKQLYRERGEAIRERLADFGKVLEQPDEKIFAEMTFCLLTPGSKARACDAVVNELQKSGLLFSGDARKINTIAKTIRFHNNKSRWIAEAHRKFATNGKLRIKDRLAGNNKELREWLVANIKGFGYKEASHFLRNVGLGKDLAIIDTHIIKNLVALKIIDETPKSLSRKRYLEIEEKVANLSAKLDIPMDELDLLLWSKETGEIFK